MAGPAIWVKKLPRDDYMRTILCADSIPTAVTVLRSVQQSPDLFDLLFQGEEPSKQVFGQLVLGHHTEDLRTLAPSAQNLYFLVVKGHKYDDIVAEIKRRVTLETPIRCSAVDAPPSARLCAAAPSGGLHAPGFPSEDKAVPLVLASSFSAGVAPASMPHSTAPRAYDTAEATVLADGSLSAPASFASHRALPPRSELLSATSSTRPPAQMSMLYRRLHGEYGRLRVAVARSSVISERSFLLPAAASSMPGADSGDAAPGSSLL